MERLRRRGADMGVAACVAWLGTREHIVANLRTCTALVCPSHREGLGRVIFEAWDAGAVPIVCRDSGGAAEIVSAADAGVVYEQQSPQALANGITRALALPSEDIARTVANGRAWLAANCEAKRYGATIAGILREACKVRSGKP